ncbi:SRPBCC family protein [Psychrobacillus antarcticus]|uniref:SRPBCC family protein n=1 Tax=Psychrobacillus antarcticus TaxID=2879115 RepID=UPI0024082335|nr:SRPBCC family protein [Psychrobacillus antarcticus]
MPEIVHKQIINAPQEICFDLARNVEVHTKTTSHTNERAVGGVTEGLLEEGDTVTWEATHFCIRQRLTAKIVSMERPNQFKDTMVKGAFHSFNHTHDFLKVPEGTLMIDTFDYKSPFGILGILADKLFLERYMKRFIITRSMELKKIAENDR